MKKLTFIIAVLIFVFTSCDSGDFVGGRYFGTFRNKTNNEFEAGNLSFRHVKIDNNNTQFFMNGLIPLTAVDKNKYSSGIVGDHLLNDFLETIPAIDSIHVCDSSETIVQMSVEAEFKSNSVQTTFSFIISPDSTTVDVEFVGYNE